MFTKMGVPNGDMALFTSLLYLPWSIKPFWSPFVDIMKTKRWWTLTMQRCMALAFILLAVTLPHPESSQLAQGNTPISLFTFTLLLFALTVFASATHDIAADGFYMLSLNTRQQATFVGIRSTFHRLSSIFGQGALVGFGRSAGIEIPEHPPGLEHYTGSHSPAVLRTDPLSPVCHPPSGYRPKHPSCPECSDTRHLQGIYPHVYYLFSQTGCMVGHHLHAALPTARSFPHQDVHAVPHR